MSISTARRPSPSISPSGRRTAPPSSGCASKGETLRFAPLVSGFAALIGAEAHPAPRSANLIVPPDSLGTEALFNHADGSFWRRHFNARFTPAGADVIVWVFDAAGTRARTWRGSAVRDD